jgi:hypothetical protein
MTNETLWCLVKHRTRTFYDRIFKPFGLSKRKDVDWMQKTLDLIYYKSRQRSDWAFYYLKYIDEAETEIALHKRTPEPFRSEINILCSRVDHKLEIEAANRGRK